MARRIFLLIALLAGCDIGTGSVAGGVQPDRGINNGSLPADCTKIEGSELGEPQTLTAGAVTVEITGWISKEGEPGEYVGFHYTADGPVDITIKSGEEVFVEDGDGTWTHPAHDISNVVICEGEEEMEEPPVCDETDPCNDPPIEEPEPDLPDDKACTTHEECETGICMDGVCVSI